MSSEIQQKQSGAVAVHYFIKAIGITNAIASLHASDLMLLVLIYQQTADTVES